MQQSQAATEFTGEYFIPGRSGKRIQADHLERYKFAARYAQGKSVLDIACGEGYSATMIVAAGATSYDGVDINQNLTIYANKKYGSNIICYYTSDISSFDSGRRYDLITCFETIEHVPNYKSALLNLHKLLKPDGLLLISSPNRVITSPNCNSFADKPENKFHTQEFTPDELLEMLRRSGFSAQVRDVFGQRQRLHWLASIRRISPRLSRKLVRIADRWSSPVPARIKRFHDPRYFLVFATKRAC
jgi:2-polyprenyl-3-methyl-5-hydroxy-6-metoxy-1,4-benzoquinol methylase